jgi:hypothetical protein
MVGLGASPMSMSMHEDQTQPPPGPIGITNPAIPVDGGLSGLGLVMSLTGAVFLVMAIGMGTIMMFSMMMAGGGTWGAGTSVLVALAVITTTAMRSWAHRAAGQRLLYDGPGTPRSAIRRYLTFSALQITLLVVALGSQGTSARVLVMLAVMLAGWPVALAIVLAGARFQALLDQQTIPPGEDKGFEGAAILMIVLGLTGLLIGVVMAIGVSGELGRILELAPFFGLSLIVIVTMMVLRSLFHVRAGLRGLVETHLDTVAGAAAKYGNFAVAAGGVIAGLFFLMMIIETGGRAEGAVLLLGLVTAIFLMWGLSTWPLIIKRFFAERQFADLLVDGQVPHVRAPDRGLTTLGWLLFGQAVMSLSMALPALLAAPLGPDDYERARDPMSEILAMFQVGGRGQWWSIAIAVLQLAASWQLLRMRPRTKMLVTLWSTAAALVAVYVHYPLLTAMAKGSLRSMFGGSEAMLSNLPFMAVASALITPIATLILVNRKHRGLPTAVLQR